MTAANLCSMFLQPRCDTPLERRCSIPLHSLDDSRYTLLQINRYISTNYSNNNSSSSSSNIEIVVHTGAIHLH